MKVERTADRVSIGELLADYADCANRRDPEHLRELFTDDATWDLGPIGRYEGIDAIVGCMAGAFDAFEGFIQVIHQGRVAFDPDDGTVASGRWYISEFGLRNDGCEVSFAGVYQDDYRCDEGGEWRFAVRRYRGLFARQGDATVVRPFPSDLPEL
jgi:ketosteroid isomerase-like protein